MVGRRDEMTADRGLLVGVVCKYFFVTFSFFFYMFC